MCLLRRAPAGDLNDTAIGLWLQPRRSPRQSCGFLEKIQSHLRLDTGSVTANFDCRLVLALTQIDDMPEKAVRRPFGVTDLDNHLGAHPMNPAEHQGRAETTAARRRNR